MNICRSTGISQRAEVAPNMKIPCNLFFVRFFGFVLPFHVSISSLPHWTVIHVLIITLCPWFYLVMLLHFLMSQQQSQHNRVEVVHPGFGSQPKLPCWGLQKAKVVSPPPSSFYWSLHCVMSRTTLCSTGVQFLQALCKMSLMFVLCCCFSVLSNFPSEKNQKMRVSVLKEHGSFLSLTFYFAHLFAWKHESLPFI